MSAISASANPSAGVDTTLYTVPAGKKSIVSVNACNISSIAYANVRFFVNDGADRYLDYDYPLQVTGGGKNTRSWEGIVLKESEVFKCRADTANVHFRMSGVEETA